MMRPGPAVCLAIAEAVATCRERLIRGLDVAPVALLRIAGVAAFKWRWFSAHAATPLCKLEYLHSPACLVCPEQVFVVIVGDVAPLVLIDALVPPCGGEFVILHPGDHGFAPVWILDCDGASVLSRAGSGIFITARLRSNTATSPSGSAQTTSRFTAASNAVRASAGV